MIFGLFGKPKPEAVTHTAHNSKDIRYFTFITGGNKPRGCGKTTLAAHLAMKHMIPPLRDFDLAKYKAEVAALRAEEWNNLEVDENIKHLVYVVDDIFTSKGMGYEPLISMELKFDELGLYSPDGEKVAHVVPYALIVIPEVQSKLDCRKSMTDGPGDHLLRLIELQRKFGIRMIADAQLYFSVEKRLREQADLIIEVHEQTHKYDSHDVDKSCPIETTWHVLEFDGARIYERYLSSGDQKDARKKTYIHNGNIFECMDSFAGKERFLDGMGKKNFDAKVAKPTGNNRLAMEEKCKRFPLVKPKKEQKRSA